MEYEKSLSSAKLYCGAYTYEAEVPEVDLDLPDEEVFEVVLHSMSMQWSSTGEMPHHKSSMAREGTVCRGKWRVYVAGNGWGVSYKTQECVDAIKEATSKQDWEALAEVTEFSSVWKYTEPKPSKNKTPRWRK